MKKVIVVVNGEPTIFRGEKLNAFNNLDKFLVIKDEEEVIAVFQNWEYWREDK